MLSVDKVWGVYSKLGKNVTNTDTEIVLKMGDGTMYRHADGGHYYLTLQNGTTREVVKVVGRKGDTLTVERGQDGTTAQTFPSGSCVKVEWNPTQLCEFIRNCTTGDKTKITAQTICMTCDTCFDIDDGGHIISVNGGNPC